MRKQAHDLINSAVAGLPDEERIEARETSAQWAETLARTALSSEDFRRMMATVGEPAEELRRMMAAVEQPAEDVRRMTAAVSGMEMGGREEEQPSELQEESEPAESDRSYIASTEGVRFHRVSCRYVDRVKPCKRVCFASRDDAVKEGYSPCSVCRP